MVKPTDREPGKRRRPSPSRRGAALVMTLLMIFMVSTLVVNIFRTEMLQLAATRNSIEYEKSLYWANAGVHHACALLAQSPPPSLPFTVTDGVLPPSTAAAGYSVTATDAGGGIVSVVSMGHSSTYLRTVEARVEGAL